MVNAATLLIFSRTLKRRTLIPPEDISMIAPPTQKTGSQERKVELDQTVEYAVQLLLEEAHLLGWQRVEFLTAVMDAANNQLSAIEEERVLEADNQGLPPATFS
jgi:hypothetical protein